MTLWRISNHSTLDGYGGLIASARWHTQGRRVVYLADSPSAALLEILVHLEVHEGTTPDSYQLLKIACPSRVSRRIVRPERLAATWMGDHNLTRKIGDRWLAAGRSALLAVPSAVAPETGNWLLNPAHRDAAFLRILSSRRFLFDRRLLALRQR